MAEQWSFSITVRDVDAKIYDAVGTLMDGAVVVWEGSVRGLSADTHDMTLVEVRDLAVNTVLAAYDADMAKKDKVTAIQLQLESAVSSRLNQLWAER